jgi:hypothetical protein
MILLQEKYLPLYNDEGAFYYQKKNIWLKDHHRIQNSILQIS